MSETQSNMNKGLIFGALAVVVLAVLTYFNTDLFTGAPDEEGSPETDTVTETATRESTPMTNTCDTYDVSGLNDPENTILMEVSSGGCVVIETYPDKAPNHVARFKELTRTGFYDGIVFHRVIDGFMAQTGDPTGTGSGGSGQNIVAEFNDVAHERGIVSTARAGHPDSADSQFFIMLGTSPHLDGQYTVWGRVTHGMEHIDAIQKGPTEQNGAVPPELQDKIVKMIVAADQG